MVIRSIKFNEKTLSPSFKKKEVKSYLEAEGAVNTNNKVKPLPPKGHLVSDNFTSGIKYFFKDIAYDMKAIKDGIQGNANDHQLGRLNDVGLKLGGIGIATYLASKTSSPRARLMEYIGLGTFLTSMSLFPKMAINTPAKLKHGFDVDKEYIDDQGRKKSVLQDANYVPYEMYVVGDKKYNKKDLDKIGDDMGIPRDIHNRHDLIKEQMRKIGTQNNTLWMLTAGFATPMMTALICNGIEKGLIPALEKSRNNKYNKEITRLLELTDDMTKTLTSDKIKHNELSSMIEKILNSYKNQQLPKEEVELIISRITKGIDENASEAIRKDLKNLFETSFKDGKEAAVIDLESIDVLVRTAKGKISKAQKAKIEPILVPTREELKAAIAKVVPEGDLSKGIVTEFENIDKIKEEIRKLIKEKINNTEGIPKSGLEAKCNAIVEELATTLKSNKSTLLTEDVIKKAVNFSKIIGEFKENQRALDICKNFKVEEAQDTILARYYEKFEKTLFKELKIEFKDLKYMRDSSSYTQDVLDKKISELVKDESRYKSVMEKLSKVVSEMEVALHGNEAESSFIKDLITAYENNFNNTAKRLKTLGFADDTIDRLVKQDVNTLKNSITSKSDLFDLLDGIRPDKFKQIIFNKDGYDKLSEEEVRNYINYNADGVGSSKNLRINRLVERYQGVRNTFNRILHTFEIYKRSQNPAEYAEFLKGQPSEYIEEVVKRSKDTALRATSSEHTLKLNLVNNSQLYRDIMKSMFPAESGDFWSTKEKGFVTESAKDAFGRKQNFANGNLLERFQYYITRFRNLIANTETDFMKPEHVLNQYVKEEYKLTARTEKSLYELLGKDPVGMFKEYAGKRYGDLVWLRKVGAITGSVFAVTLLAQLCFGKIRNPQNIKKQVNNESNS